MKSPFPGMDPYLEGSSWPDVHSRLAVAISNTLAASIPPQYSIRLEPTVIEDESGENVGIMYPDVLLHHPAPEQDPVLETGRAPVATLTPPVTFPAEQPRRVIVPTIHIRLAGERTLVTSIEIVSPANKTGAPLERFGKKWRRLKSAGVNLVEIDLIRRGRRIFSRPELSPSDYLITVTRGDADVVGAWPFSIRDTIPPFPVPLLAPDPDAVVELQPMLELIYNQGRYGNDIDYSGEPPPPALSPEDLEWMRARIAEAAAAS